ncbi:MAG TPA: radical SAM family heme chaperone HemW [Flavobacteriales bacterium]|nr:radical SAM family heme chaperone HemW [Flavobacteriales bacterium]
MIYLHIPFCKQACHYCDFHFSTSMGFRSAVLEAMNREIEQRKEEWNSGSMQTIYFGGGTPSLLSKEELTELLQTIRTNFIIDKNAEITLEANPDDITPEKLSEWKAFGINRLSIGIQSFRDEDLKLLNRAHQAEEALQSIRNAQEAGITNITIDLIYGIPGLEISDWIANLDLAIETDVPHISAYCLTVEPGTALESMVKKGKISPMNEDQGSEHFLILRDKLIAAGFEHYEISNFGKPGFHSRHNSAYWRGKPYIGIGPSAPSYSGNTRRWNVSNNKKYFDAINTGEPFWESEELSDATRYNEYILTGLRTSYGVSEEEIATLFGEQFRKHFRDNLFLWDLPENIQEENGRIVLTAEGRLVADRIISDLFWVDRWISNIS